MGRLLLVWLLLVSWATIGHNSQDNLGDATETLAAPKPINKRDCLIEWPPWPKCDQPCGTKKTVTRTAKILQQSGPDSNKPCSEMQLTQSKVCDVVACPIHCKMSSWTKWSKCDKPCGAGSQSRTRTIITKPLGEDAEKCGALEEERNCNLGPCPQHCAIRWTSFSSCRSRCGVQYYRRRTYKILRPGKWGGKLCPTKKELKELSKKKCPFVFCPQHCRWGPWQPGQCSHPCGSKGTRIATRKHAVVARYGGKQCVGPSSRREHCNRKQCPIHCQLTPWKIDRNCSKKCGGGYRFKRRKILVRPKFGGNPCGVRKQIHSRCNSHACPRDCKLSPWSDWSKCSTQCGPGFQTRSQKIVRLHSGLGAKRCPLSSDLTERRPCNTQPDQACRDCQQESWSDWSQCSHFCGGGTQFRVAPITAYPSAGRKKCGPTIEHRSCNTQPCDRRCVLTPWSRYSTCQIIGDVCAQLRVRSILEPSDPLGQTLACARARTVVKKICDPVKCGLAPKEVKLATEKCKLSVWSYPSRCEPLGKRCISLQVRSILAPLGALATKVCAGVKTARVTQCEPEKCFGRSKVTNYTPPKAGAPQTPSIVTAQTPSIKTARRAEDEEEDEEEDEDDLSSSDALTGKKHKKHKKHKKKKKSLEKVSKSKKLHSRRRRRMSRAKSKKVAKKKKAGSTIVDDDLDDEHHDEEEEEDEARAGGSKSAKKGVKKSKQAAAGKSNTASGKSAKKSKKRRRKGAGGAGADGDEEDEGEAHTPTDDVEF